MTKNYREFEFDVGDSEKHLVSFTWNQGRADARFSVDGVEVLRERRRFDMGLLRRYGISVGSSEVHSVSVEKSKPRVFGGMRKPSFRAFVDGNQVGEY